ncbi:MAG: hypothetical protein A2901_06555 [Elusimicrobia bacterium RIFCSPLOWO2_01_FULL_54_10]|nr:MAG: hypothetical protein A2901_06555 [Elusimicrobia bacterium RIFCSPLOWO2_01_FULL_54_10]
MTLITIPKELAQKGDLALVPRKEYEEFLKFKKIREFTPTIAERKALAKARRDFQKGNFLTLEQLDRFLARRRTS